jgi:hypothetical protein
MTARTREDVVPILLTPEQWERVMLVFGRASYFLRTDAANAPGTYESLARIEVARELLCLADEWEGAKLAQEEWLESLTRGEDWPAGVRRPQATSWEDGR